MMQNDLEKQTNVPNFLIWKCANCGAQANGLRKPCGCVTNVGVREGPTGKRESTWWQSREVSENVDLRARLEAYEAALRYVLEDDGLIPRATSACREVVRKALEAK